jgi:hypothetical protein
MLVCPQRNQICEHLGTGRKVRSRRGFRLMVTDATQTRYKNHACLADLMEVPSVVSST